MEREKWVGGPRVGILQPRLMFYFNTNKPHSFFCRIPVVLESRRSSQGVVGGGGVEHPSHPPPRSATASASGFSLISALTSYRRKARTFTYMFDCVNA